MGAIRQIRDRLKIGRRIQNVYDKASIYKSRRYEINKYKDPRRIKIYSEVNLTEEQKNKIDQLYSVNYGEKVPYTWHRHFTAFTGRFDEKYFPELLYVPEFEHFMNMNRAYCTVLSDKSITQFIAKALNVYTPYTHLYVTKNVFRDAVFRQIDRKSAEKNLENIGEVFCKPSIDSNSGQGCIIADFRNGYDCVSGEKVHTVLDQLGHDYIIQERLKCHSSIRLLYSGSVNTFRVITYRWQDEIRHIPVIMRMGRNGSYLDNAHAGGIFIAIDDNGTLHDKAFTEFRDIFTMHPDSLQVFSENRIPLVNKVIDAAERMHMAVSELGVVNWDFTIDELGNPILIEANLRAGSVWLSEMAHGCGPFGKDTDIILRWMRLMKKVKVTDRSRYAFGKNFE